MRKIYQLFVFVLLSVFIAKPIAAIELKRTPIQTELANSILLASDNWNLNDDGKKEVNSSVVALKNNGKKKSAFKAALYSALIPGLGERYVGRRTKAKVFFAAEAMTWISYIAFHSYGVWKKDDMIRFASDKAGASLDGKDDEYFDWLGFYNSTEEFNSLGRVSDPERKYLTGAENYWQWTSDADRNDYRAIKNSSRTAFNRANFMIVAAIGNRIISIIDAIRDAKHTGTSEKIDISDENSYNYKFAIDPLSYNRQFTLTVMTPF